ncbi:MAG: DUF1858 domain-containing protein [Chloroflexi bacterium]|nr:DUF1858 domain-containing protein [Chloroflexota bacterium]
MNAQPAPRAAVPGISPDTRLSQVLDAVPGALDYIVSLKPHDFGRLRNPVLRRYMSSRISLRRVAVMVGVPEQRLADDLTRLAHGEAVAAPTVSHEGADASEPPRRPEPAWLQAVDAAAIPWVDVVPIDEVGGDPFPPISLAVKQLAPDGVLAIRHRWEPQPLYDVWGKMGVEWFAERIGKDEWYIFVHRPASASAAPSKAVVAASVGHTPEGEVLPRLQVLAEQLGPGQTLEATGLNGERLAEVQHILQQRLGADYQVDQATPASAAAVLRVTHLSP